MSHKTVYFNIRPASRERMWDTTKYAANICDVVLPKGVEQQSSIKVYSKTSKSFLSKVKYEVSKKLINSQKIDQNAILSSELIYMWGSFPKNTKKPFVLELDNPYTPAYYHLENFKRNKEKIRAKFDEAYKITYLSETCMGHTLELYGKDLEKKSFVNYPYMAENYKKNNREKGIINFIFVGLNSKGKGGEELLEAFFHTSDEELRLTFISNLSDEIKGKYEKDSRIKILSPQPREKLLNEIYPKMDIMVFPSFYESFGVVLLEALSFGMGLISMNTYAIPEMLKDNYNGKLVHHPILKPTLLNSKEVVNCVDLRIKEFYERYLYNGEFYYGLYEELKNAIELSILNYTLWQENSVELFNEKFSPDAWEKNFKIIIE